MEREIEHYRIALNRFKAQQFRDTEVNWENLPNDEDFEAELATPFDPTN